jgi:CRISPR system Cascade subunit CasB
MTQPAQRARDRRDQEAERVRDYHFIAELERLVPSEEDGAERRGDRAALAALRRAAGRPPGESPAAYPAVYRALGDEPLQPWEETPYFIVAPLFALYPHGSWRRGDEEERYEPRSLGASFARLAERTGSGSIEGRFRALLDSRIEDVPEHLRHAVGLLRAHEVPVSWTELLGDIRRWDDERRSVQRKWARHYWGHIARIEQQASAADASADDAGGGDED